VQICIPINEDEGIDSQVCGHFGSAPAFMIVDTETGACRAITNNNSHHAHGNCQPLAAIAGESVDGVVVGGIGMGALIRLLQANIAVFRSEYPTVAQTLEAFKAGTLQPVSPEGACQGHGHQH
jgi:predicted Fe-Mo cluster-binding NifX family protein